MYFELENETKKVIREPRLNKYVENCYDKIEKYITNDLNVPFGIPRNKYRVKYLWDLIFYVYVNIFRRNDIHMEFFVHNLIYFNEFLRLSLGNITGAIIGISILTSSYLFDHYIGEDPLSVWFKDREAFFDTSVSKSDLTKIVIEVWKTMNMVFPDPKISFSPLNPHPYIN